MEPVENAPDLTPDIEPVVVLSQTFGARPSSIPEIRDFVQRCLMDSPLDPEANRELQKAISQALLDAASPTGKIQVSFRIYLEHVEVDVLRSDPALPSPFALPAMLRDAPSQEPERDGTGRHDQTFAAWMATIIKKEGLTKEAAARQLGVSVKTVSRWVGGQTEPRMKDLRRIREIFGDVPLR